jgi:hypothetical protein
MLAMPTTYLIFQAIRPVIPTKEETLVSLYLSRKPTARTIPGLQHLGLIATLLVRRKTANETLLFHSSGACSVRGGACRLLTCRSSGAGWLHGAYGG